MKAQNRFYFAWPWHSKISPKIVDRVYFGPKIDHSSACERIQDTSQIAGDFGVGASMYCTLLSACMMVRLGIHWSFDAILMRVMQRRICLRP